ncbi:MAG TPA: M20 family metallopeptidase [Mycobacteriales bacterium]|nr:M20 family metallopeptidase [Mycobacteriales bacterium]
MTSLLTELVRREPTMLDQLATLVGLESPSPDLVATATAAEAVDALFTELLGHPAQRHDDGGRIHLRWQGGGPTRVLLIGHVDTVWPLGTLARWPFDVVDGRATGPGVFDMKAGLVQGLHALSLLDDLTGVTFVVTTDEETGSGTSRSLIEESARGAEAALVLEPSAGGALKSARKGVSMYELVVHGRAAHAGLEPEKGVNAAVELAHQVLALEPLADPGLGTTVTPTQLSGGTTSNTVPAGARVAVDVRVATPDEQVRVDAAIRGAVAHLRDARIEVLGGPNRPPLPAASSAYLLSRARAIASELGIPPLRDVAVGGGSDGNFTAGVGVATLDGLGAVGDGAHAEGEHVLVASMAERGALVAGLVRDVLGRERVAGDAGAPYAAR